jgi:hypothetical protein
MKARVLLVVLVAAGVAWLAGDRLGSWVRPIALAAFAGALVLLLWPRIGGRKHAPRSDAGRDAAPDGTADAVEPTSKELWDALDRGEDPTSTSRS